jgi:phage terminase large subunit GpA-like protein
MLNLNPARSEIAQFCDSFRPREKLSVCAWALKHRYLAKGVTSKPGKYSLDAGPYQREPQESFTDPEVMITVLMWASRTGKTECLNNLDGYVIHHDPKAILKVYPTLDSAAKWRKEFFNPMITATPVLREKINIKSRHSDNTMLALRFPGGNISSIGTNSPSGFRQIQAPVVECDEIDAMEDGKEGDPITLAFKRADNYSDSIQVLSSTPTTRGYSRIESWLDKSDFRQWFCPCAKCGMMQVLKWSQVQWPEDDPKNARYICEAEGCRHAHTDQERMGMIREGE